MSAARNPLLSEVDERSFLGKWLRRIPLLRAVLRNGDPPLWFLAVPFPLLALVATVLGSLSGASAIDVVVRYKWNPSIFRVIPVGYLYESNAAPFYVAISWLWVAMAARFLTHTNLALAALVDKGRLTAPSGTVHDTVANLNRRWCSPWLMSVILILGSGTVIWTEFDFRRAPDGRRIGDYWSLGFGYVQAAAIPHYRIGKPLDQLGRKVEDIKVFEIQDPSGAYAIIPISDWTLGEVASGGARTPRERRLFKWFLVFAVGVEALFVPFVVWIVLKVWFVLWLLYRSLSASPFPLRLTPQPDDWEKAFGMIELDRIYRSVIFLIYVCTSAQIMWLIANVGKGSDRSFGSLRKEQFAVLLGQSAVAWVAVLLVASFGLFLLLMSRTLRKIHRAALLAPPDDPRALERIKKQNLCPPWIIPKLLGALLSYGLPPLLILRSWRQLHHYHESWLHVARSIDGLIRTSGLWK